MVDFQQRDTTRGFDDDDAPGRNGAGAEDGEAELDEVRQQLEERPSEAEDDQDGGRGTDESGDDEGDDERTGDDHRDGESDDDHHHADVETLGAAVVTISSSRTMDDDPSGDHIVSAMVDAGHDVVTRELIADDFDGIQGTVDSLLGRSDVDVVVTTGGTGVTPDDRTIEAIRPLFEKELPGFGELFRSLSYDDIGSRIVATRATAGVADGVPVFCLPGSTDAVRLGVGEIIVDVAPHLAGLASPEGDGHGHDEHGHGHGQDEGRAHGGDDGHGADDGDDHGRAGDREVHDPAAEDDEELFVEDPDRSGE